MWKTMTRDQGPSTPWGTFTLREESDGIHNMNGVYDGATGEVHLQYPPSL